MQHNLNVRILSHRERGVARTLMVRDDFGCSTPRRSYFGLHEVITSPPEMASEQS